MIATMTMNAAVNVILTMTVTVSVNVNVNVNVNVTVTVTVTCFDCYRQLYSRTKFAISWKRSGALQPLKSSCPSCKVIFKQISV